MVLEERSEEEQFALKSIERGTKITPKQKEFWICFGSTMVLFPAKEAKDLIQSNINQTISSINQLNH